MASCRHSRVPALFHPLQVVQLGSCNTRCNTVITVDAHTSILLSGRTGYEALIVQLAILNANSKVYPECFAYCVAESEIVVVDSAQLIKAGLMML